MKLLYILTNLNNYNFIHKSRANNSGGGVGMYILNNIEFKLREDVTKNFTSIDVYYRVNVYRN